jgi:hypothetical protein
MDLTLREECWIKISMQLITVIFLGNYYIQFYHPSFKQCTKVGSFCWSGSPSLFQVELMSLCIIECDVLPPSWIVYAII